LLVVDQRLPFGVAGQADVFGLLAGHDLDDPVALSSSMATHTMTGASTPGPYNGMVTQEGGV